MRRGDLGNAAPGPPLFLSPPRLGARLWKRDPEALVAAAGHGSIRRIVRAQRGRLLVHGPHREQSGQQCGDQVWEAHLYRLLFKRLYSSSTVIPSPAASLAAASRLSLRCPLRTRLRYPLDSFERRATDRSETVPITRSGRTLVLTRRSISALGRSFRPSFFTLFVATGTTLDPFPPPCQ